MTWISRRQSLSQPRAAASHSEGARRAAFLALQAGGGSRERDAREHGPKEVTG
jgi:hypothetical protein